MENSLQEIDKKIQEMYKDYKTLYAKLTTLTQSITELENERNEVIEKDGRKFMFRKSVVELIEFTKILKVESWIDLEYEGFEDNTKNYIAETAMIVDVYCFQANHASPVRFILVLSGYLSEEEYDGLNKKHNLRLPPYYVHRP